MDSFRGLPMDVLLYLISLDENLDNLIFLLDSLPGDVLRFGNIGETVMSCTTTGGLWVKTSLNMVIFSFRLINLRRKFVCGEFGYCVFPCLITYSFYF